MNYKKQKGFTLLELVLVMVIVGVMMIIEMEKKFAEIDQLQARQLGVELYQYSKGVQEYISSYSGDIETVFGAGATVGDTITKTGTAWLKSTTCLDDSGAVKGQANSSFVSCEFMDMRDGIATSFGSIPVSTELTYKSEGEIIGVTVLDGLEIGGDFAGSLSGLAALVASGAASISSTDTTVFTSEADIFYCVTAEGAKCGDNGNGISYQDKIVILNNADSSSDYWLRTDHGNTMASAIEFDENSNDVNNVWGNGFSVRQIKNVARIYNEGITGSDSLIIGKDVIDDAAILASSAGVIIDADQDILGELNVAKDIKTNQNIIAEKDITAGIDLTVNRNAIIKNELTVYGDQSIGGNSYLNGNIVGPNTGDASNRYVYIDGLVDYDNSAYKLDPDGQSVLYDLDVNNTLNATNLNVTGSTVLNVDGKSYNVDELFPNMILKSTEVVIDGGIAIKVSCPGMTNKIVVTPALVYLNSYQINEASNRRVESAGQFVARAEEFGTYYRISSRSVGGTTPSRSGVAIVSQYCKR